MEMIAKAEQDRQEASVSQPVYVLEGEPMAIEQPNIEDVSHEQVVELQAAMHKPAAVSTTAPVVVPEDSAPAPTMPQAPVRSALSNNLAEGTLQNELKELYKKIRKPVKERIVHLYIKMF